MAGAEVQFSPTGKRLPLRPEEDRRAGDQDDEPFTEIKRPGLSQRGFVPPIRETQDVAADGHHVERESLRSDPSADGRFLTDIISQAEGAEPSFDLSVPEASGCPNHDVHVGRWADARGSTRRDQELRDLAPNEDHLTKKRLDPPSHCSRTARLSEAGSLTGPSLLELCLEDLSREVSVPGPADAERIHEREPAIEGHVALDQIGSRST